MSAISRFAACFEEERFQPLHEGLRGIGDIERILARVALKTARPRDLVQLRSALSALPDLRLLLEGMDSPRVQDLSSAAGEFPELLDLLRRAVDRAAESRGPRRGRDRTRIRCRAGRAALAQRERRQLPAGAGSTRAGTQRTAQLSR